MKFRHLSTWAAGLTLSLATVLAGAHGTAGHVKKPQAVVKEQKAWGIAGDAKTAGRTVKISMTDDMRFTPDRLRFKLGETVRFIVDNDGIELHEFVIGTQSELDEHAALMAKFPGMEHDEPYMAHVEPGSRGEVVWTFNRAGEFGFACLIPRHYKSGMVGTISVVADQGSSQ
jgi:uncharacterized cupredoxin-like copper-binding protein